MRTERIALGVGGRGGGEREVDAMLKWCWSNRLRFPVEVRGWERGRSMAQS